MKIRLVIKNYVQLQPEVVEEKINNYLKRNYYRVTERGPTFVVFTDDEFSERKSRRSDLHTRIGEGKFELHPDAYGTSIKLVYFTPVGYPFFIMMLFVGFGLYFKVITPILMSLAFTMPLIYRIYYLNLHVFKEILE